MENVKYVLIVDEFFEADGVNHASGRALPKESLDAEVDKALRDWSTVFRIDLLNLPAEDMGFAAAARLMAVESAYASAEGERRTVQLDKKYGNYPDLIHL